MAHATSTILSSRGALIHVTSLNTTIIYTTTPTRASCTPTYISDHMQVLVVNLLDLIIIYTYMHDLLTHSNYSPIKQRGGSE